MACSSTFLAEYLLFLPEKVDNEISLIEEIVNRTITDQDQIKKLDPNLGLAWASFAGNQTLINCFLELGAKDYIWAFSSAFAGGHLNVMHMFWENLDINFHKGTLDNCKDIYENHPDKYNYALLEEFLNQKMT